MCLGNNHIEKADEYIEWISNSYQDNLRLVRNIQNSSPGVMGFVDPASVFDDAFSLETLVLKRNVQSEFHDLVGACGDTCDIFKVLSKHSVSRSWVACVRNGIK